MPAGPFGDSEVEEVFLPRAPLLFALTQVRYPKTPHLVERSTIDEILVRLGDQLPVLREEAAQTLVIAQTGGQNVFGPPQQQSVFRFFSKDEKWKLSLTEDSLSFDTSAYASRDDFIARFSSCLAVLIEVGPPVVCDRIGLRYVDQIQNRDLGRLPEFIRPEVLGVSSTDLSPGTLVHSFTQTLIRHDDHEATLRWGIVPAGINFDPTFPPTTEPSWVLDIDVYTTRTTDFSLEGIVDLEREFANTAYRFFRWSTTDEMIAWAGGEV